MNKQTSPTKGKEATKTEKQQQSQSPTKIDKPAAPNKTEIIKPEKPTKGNPKAQGGIYLTEPNSKTPREDLSPRKPENVLVSSGLLNAYDYLQDQFCKHGFPKGNVFEYAAVTILKYERKLKGKEAWKKLEERDREIEKAKKHIDLSNSPKGKSPRNEKSPQARDKSPKQEDPKLQQGKAGDKNRSKSPPPREEEIKGKTKPGNKSPQAKDEIVQPTKGKGDKSPPHAQQKEDPKAKGKGDKSPPPAAQQKEDPKAKGKDDKKGQPAPGKTVPAEAKKTEPMSNKAGGGVKKK